MDEYAEHWNSTLMGQEFWKTARLLDNEEKHESTHESGLSALHIATGMPVLSRRFTLSSLPRTFTPYWPFIWLTLPRYIQLGHRPIQSLSIQPGSRYGAASPLPGQ